MSTSAMPDGIDPSGPATGARDLLRIAPIGIDDWSDVRYVHGSAFRTLLSPHVSPESSEAFMAALAAPGYAERFAAGNLRGAWLDGRLVGTSGWRPSPGRDGIAAIEGLFVSPLFTFMGFGSALLAHAESQARRAGCEAFMMSVPPVSVPFLLRFGYDVAAHGADLADADGDEPMFVMRKRCHGEPVSLDDADDRQRAPVFGT